MRIHYLQLSALLTCLFLAVSAQSQSREPGWEFRADLLYQNQKDVHTSHGSDIGLDTGWGASLGAGYRFNPYAEMHFMLDFLSLNYDATVVRADITNVVASFSDKVDITTPRLVGEFNFLNGPITPYVSAGIGWSYVHTNVPYGPTQIGCWWDPWFGYVCGSYGNSFSNDKFTYDIGTGIRWDFNQLFSMRFGYEKHWVDLGSNAGMPNLDQFRIGFQFAY